MKPTNLALRLGIRTGLVMAAVALFIVLTGMIEAFAEREMLGGATLGSAILVLLGLIPGLMGGGSFRKKADLNELPATPGNTLLAGLIAGLITGLGIAFLAWLMEQANLRTILVNATPDLSGILRLGQESLSVAMLLLTLGGGLLGLLGAAFRLLPSLGRRAIVILLMAWLFVSLLDLDFIAFMVVLIFLGWLSQRYGGNLLAAANNSNGSDRSRRMALFGLLIVAWIAVMGIGPALLGDYWARVLGFVGLYAMLGLGLNIVVGFAGLLDLGYVAFYAIGAYTMALLTSPASSLGLELNFWIILPVSMITAALTGVLLGIPVLRMRGDYLAIVTLGFGEIIRIMANSDALKSLIGGPQGILETPFPAIPGIETIKPLHIYYLVVLGSLLVAFVSTRLSYSRVGRAWIAMREDEDVAQAMGINLVKNKLLAFATGAAFAGISGAIFASWQHAIFPADFTLFISINVLVLIIIGGLGSIPGVIVGAAVLVGLPEVLREIQDYRILAYGALLVIMMIARPEGIIPSQRRKLEMHAGEGTGSEAPAPSSG